MLPTIEIVVRIGKSFLANYSGAHRAFAVRCIANPCSRVVRLFIRAMKPRAMQSLIRAIKFRFEGVLLREVALVDGANSSEISFADRLSPSRCGLRV